MDSSSTEEPNLLKLKKIRTMVKAEFDYYNKIALINTIFFDLEIWLKKIDSKIEELENNQTKIN